MPAPDARATRIVQSDLPIDVRLTLSPLHDGRGDPCSATAVDEVWRAWQTPDGAATARYRGTAPTTVEVTAWGPGRDWALEQAPATLGAHDDLTGFDPGLHPAVSRANRALPGLRMGASGLVEDSLVRTIFGQKVTGLQAKRAWRRLVTDHGTPAPGPAGTGEGAPTLLAPPTAREIAAMPYWAFHPWGVERKRAEIVRAACARIDRLEEAVDMTFEDGVARLHAIRGIGPWTSAIVLRTATGHADHVEVGDYHLPDVIAFNLAGEARADDARMLDLLEPFRGHRGRVMRLIAIAGAGKPTYGPRLTPHLVERL